MNIGLKIRELRKQLNLSQAELADLLGVSQKTISSYEINRTQPTIEMIEAMCKVFNCKKTDFMDEQPNFDYVVELDNDEKIIIEHIREVPLKDRKYLFEIIKSLIDYSKSEKEKDK